MKLCVFALLLQRAAEIACNDTWRNVRRALRSIQAIECETPNGSFVRTTKPSREALAYLKKLRVEPPPKVLRALAAGRA